VSSTIGVCILSCCSHCTRKGHPGGGSGLGPPSSRPRAAQAGGSAFSGGGRSHEQGGHGVTGRDVGDGGHRRSLESA
jgi:hypothetical protein